VARELALFNLDEALDGTQVSSLVDGPPGTRMVAPGLSIDLPVLTNQLTCARDTLCTSAQVHAITTERPWGVNNPRWRLFLHQPLVPPPLPTVAATPYVVAWIGDDARETDGDAAVDGAGPGQEGRYMVRARVEAFGAQGGRRAIDAELARVCAASPTGVVCLPGSRVYSWRVATTP
jgi:hypothetical protein